jgi:hypothetical protein
MKIQNIFKLLFVAFFALQFSACEDNTDVDPKFDKTPTDRLNAQMTELQQLLLSSPEGWKAVYFTDNTVLGGYTHLFKFAADGTVEMASDFDTDTDIYKSEYQIQLGSTVSLTFTTKNRIHLLSESDNYPITALRAKGYLGDFQFLYYGQENGQIVFRANRNKQEIRFVKATNEDWDNLPKNFDMIPNVVGANTRPLFRLLETNDGTTKHQFDFSFSEVTRYAEANSIETGYSVSYNLGIGYTPTGIVVNPAVEVGGQKLTEFVYNDADGSFTATGTNGVTATIKYTNKPLIITDDYKILLEGQPQFVLGYIDANLYTAASTSIYTKSLIDKVNSTLPANQKLARVQLIFNNAVNGSYIQYTFNGGKASIVHFVTTSEDAVNKTLIISDDGWTVNAASRAFLAELDAELLNPGGLYVKKESFRVTYTNTIYTLTSASTNFRLTTYQL